MATTAGLTIATTGLKLGSVWLSFAGFGATQVGLAGALMLSAGDGGVWGLAGTDGISWQAGTSKRVASIRLKLKAKKRFLKILTNKILARFLPKKRTPKSSAS
jgi:hypothetical protein